jgi:hypothetical protein
MPGERLNARLLKIARVPPRLRNFRSGGAFTYWQLYATLRFSSEASAASQITWTDISGTYVCKRKLATSH